MYRKGSFRTVLVILEKTRAQLFGSGNWGQGNMADTVLGIPTHEYEAIRKRLTSYEAAPQAGSLGPPGSMYSVDSLGRVWGRMVDGRDIYLVNDVLQEPAKRLSAQQNPVWRAEADK
jgi:hypothetical protein